MTRRSLLLPEKITPECTPRAFSAWRSWVDFWFTPVEPIGLHRLRVLAGLLFLFWLLAFVGQRDAFFGLGGWFDRQAYREAARLPGGAPVPLGWSILHWCTTPTLLTTAYWLSIVVLMLFTAGLWLRVTAVLTWVVVVSFIGNPALYYGGDYLLGILAFYLMLGYVFLGQWSQPQSGFTRLVGSRETWLFAPQGDSRPSYAANLALRLLQVHFALVVVVSGLHKLQFGDWWSGMAFWYPLHPPLETTADTLRADAAHRDAYLFFLSLAQYVVLAWQICFPLFAWRNRLRPVLLIGALLGWAGSVFLYREPLFGPVLCIGCLSYLTAAEWQALRGRLTRGFPMSRWGRRLVIAPKEPARVGTKP